MRGLFKLDDGQLWGSGLIGLGILFLVGTFIANRFGLARNSPPEAGEMELFFLLIGLGIVFIVLGATVKKICKIVSVMMDAYDNELSKRFESKTAPE